MTVDELFEDDGWYRLHDIAFEFDDKVRTKNEIRQLFECLPYDVQNLAYKFGMDTVFGDAAYEYFIQNPHIL